MIMNVTFLTHMGGVREENQDAVFISDVVMTGNMRVPKICNFDSRDYPILLAVIDGMGGYTGGALAAKIVGETLADSCKIQKKNLFNACQDANECKRMLFQLFSKAICRMNEKVQNNPIFSKMGVTVSGILLRERNALTFNCGDCRVYRLRDGSLELVTRDHSVVQNLFEQEEISEDEESKAAAQVQKITDDFVKQVDAEAQVKEKEILEF